MRVSWILAGAALVLAGPGVAQDIARLTVAGECASVPLLPAAIPVVEVTIGGSTWRTSLFPSREAGAFILPIKKAVRVAEGCEEGSRVRVRLTVDP